MSVRLAADLVALQGAVDGGSGDAEQVGQLGGAVSALPIEVHEVRFLAGVEFGLLAAQLALGLGHPHAFLGAQADQVGFELGDHGQHVEQRGLTSTEPTAVTTSSGADAWLYIGPDKRGRELEVIALEVHPAGGGRRYLLVIHVMPTQLRGDSP